MAAKRQIVQQKLCELMNFVSSSHKLCNSHYGNFFSLDLWSTVLPKEIQNELCDVDKVKEFSKIYPKIFAGNSPEDYVYQNYPKTVEFVRRAYDISLLGDKSFLLPLEKLYMDLFSLGCTDQSDITIRRFMNRKKLHEVKVMSKLSACLSNLTKSLYFIDIGGGKGYLSSILTLHYGFKVLGVDSSEMVTCGAKARSKNLAKRWKFDGIDKTFLNKNELALPEANWENNNLRKMVNSVDYQNFIKNFYKQELLYVTPDINLSEILKNNFQDDIDGVNLLGLHTCGNLAATCVKLFVNNSKAKSLVNLGCCYNIMDEEFPPDDVSYTIKQPIMEEKDVIFPMSSFLKEKKFSLGRNTRMLACHSLDKFLSEYSPEFSVTTIIYRAMLQVLLEKKLQIKGPKVCVDKLLYKCTNFHEFLQKASKSLDKDFQMTDDEITDFFNEHKSKESFLRAFYLIKLAMAPVIESLILLDKQLFLLEQGIENAYIVPMFDLSISPRGFGIVAWKMVEKG